MGEEYGKAVELNLDKLYINPIFEKKRCKIHLQHVVQKIPQCITVYYMQCCKWLCVDKTQLQLTSMQCYWRKSNEEYNYYFSSIQQYNGQEGCQLTWVGDLACSSPFNRNLICRISRGGFSYCGTCSPAYFCISYRDVYDAVKRTVEGAGSDFGNLIDQGSALITKTFRQKCLNW